MDHVLDSTRTDRDDAAFRVIAYAAKRDVLDFLLRAQVLAHHLYSDLVRVFRTRDVVENVIPIFLFKVKVLHREGLLFDRDLECLEGSPALHFDKSQRSHFNLLGTMSSREFSERLGYQGARHFP
jgi:hypothetical protein